MSSYRRYITENTPKEAQITEVIPVGTRYSPSPASEVTHICRYSVVLVGFYRQLRFSDGSLYGTDERKGVHEKCGHAARIALAPKEQG
jgi:hypothetical protein